jgi:hypothetical protein
MGTFIFFRGWKEGSGCSSAVPCKRSRTELAILRLLCTFMHVKLLSSLDQPSAIKRTQASAGMSTIGRMTLRDAEEDNHQLWFSFLRLASFQHRWQEPWAVCCCSPERDCLELLSLTSARVQDRI